MVTHLLPTHTESMRNNRFDQYTDGTSPSSVIFCFIFLGACEEFIVNG